MIFLVITGLVLMTLLGAPLFTVLTAAAMAGFTMLGIDLSVMAIELYRIADTPILVALPLFTFTGYLLAESRTASRLVAPCSLPLPGHPG